MVVATSQATIRLQVGQVADVEHAPAERLETDQHAQRGNAVQQPLRKPAGERLLYVGSAGADE